MTCVAPFDPTARTLIEPIPAPPPFPDHVPVNSFCKIAAVITGGGGRDWHWDWDWDWDWHLLHNRGRDLVRQGTTGGHVRIRICVTVVSMSAPSSSAISWIQR